MQRFVRKRLLNMRTMYCGEGDESLPELIREIAEGAPIDVPGVVLP